jgi:antitoxin component of MazEF toxin-antitoxin module
MVKTIGKSGNSGSITLSKALMELMHVEIGDQVAVDVVNGRLIVTPVNLGFSDDEIDAAAKQVFTKYAKTFKKLAE